MTIKVGDLVMVVRSRCCQHDLLGSIFRVTETSDNPWGAECSECLTLFDSETTFEDGTVAFFADEIRRIPPLSELEGARDALSERTPTKEKA